MKKLLSMLLIGFTLIVLTACGSNGISQADYDALVAQNEALQAQLTTLEGERDRLQEQVEELFEQLSEFLDREVDAMVTFVIETDDPEVLNVPYLSSMNLTIFEILTGVLRQRVGYNTDFGSPFVTRIGGMDTQFGNFIQILRNGVPLDVGIGDATHQNGDVFTFRLMWWDTRAETIHNLLSTYEETLLESALLNHNFYLHHAFALRYRGAGLSGSFSPEPAQTPAGLVSQLLTARSLGVSETAYANALIEALPTLTINDDYLFLNSLVFAAVESYNHLNVINFIDAFSTYVSELDFDSIESIDSLAMLILATHKEFNLLEAIERLEEVAPTLDNSPVLALTIAALIVGERNPLNIVNDDEVNLVDKLLDYHLGGGLFKWQLSDTQADTMFSTPQSLLALVMIENFLNNNIVQPFYRP